MTILGFSILVVTVLTGLILNDTINESKRSSEYIVLICFLMLIGIAMVVCGTVY